ncbi:MAG: amidohydrolase family protein [bacterium]|nr:amidohydrolase family protein [bacterium]
MVRTLYHNCNLFRPATGSAEANSWILVEGRKFSKLGNGALPKADKSIDLGGRMVVPGLINAHTHLYSALAPRMPWPEKRPADFQEILRKVWWRLDRALDERSLRACVRLGLFEAIRTGCTTVIDHHSSPGIQEGALAIIAEEAEHAGIKTALSCEVSDRNGEDALEDAMDENLRSMRNYENHDNLRAIYGLHASFTLSEETIDQVLEILPFETPFHLHCAEAEIDNRDARESGFDSVVERLMSLGLLRPGTILAHGVHLQAMDVELIRDLGAYVVHCPQSNLHNGVGSANVGAMLAAGVKVGLGTDGFMSSLFAEAGFARKTGIAKGTLTPRMVGELLYNGNAAIASSIFKRPIGWLEEGEDADFVVLDGTDPVFPTGEIDQVISMGKVVCKKGVVCGMDSEALMTEADLEAARIWDRIYEL